MSKNRNRNKRNQSPKTGHDRIHKERQEPKERPLEHYTKHDTSNENITVEATPVEKQVIPMVAPGTKTPRLAEIGRTGLVQFSGFLGEEDLKQLQDSSKRLKIYKEMRDNSPVIGAILFTIDMFMRQVPWFVTPVDDEPQSEDEKEFVESLLDDMSSSWADTLSEIFSFVPWGWSYHEVVLKKRNGRKKNQPGISSKFNDGKIGWRKIPIRGQDTLNRWLFDDEGGLEGMEQIAAPDFKTSQIPIERALLFRTQVYKNNPEGKALLRNMFRPWFFAKRIETFEAIGLERDLAGLPVMTVPPEWTSSDATPDEKALYESAKNIVVNLKRDEQEGVIIPAIFEDGNQLMKLELLSAGGKRSFDTDKIIQRYNTQIAMTALADFIFLGHEQVGSFALADSKTNLFSVALGTYLDMVAGVFNRHAIPRLWELNGMDMDRIPTLEHGDLESTNAQVLSEIIKNLSGAGLDFGDIETVNQLRRVLELPEVEETFESDDELVEAVKTGFKDIGEAINE